MLLSSTGGETLHLNQPATVANPYPMIPFMGNWGNNQAGAATGAGAAGGIFGGGIGFVAGLALAWLLGRGREGQNEYENRHTRDIYEATARNLQSIGDTSSRIIKDVGDSADRLQKDVTDASYRSAKDNCDTEARITKTVGDNADRLQQDITAASQMFHTAVHGIGDRMSDSRFETFERLGALSSQFANCCCESQKETLRLQAAMDRQCCTLQHDIDKCCCETQKDILRMENHLDRRIDHVQHDSDMKFCNLGRDIADRCCALNQKISDCCCDLKLEMERTEARHALETEKRFAQVALTAERDTNCINRNIDNLRCELEKVKLIDQRDDARNRLADLKYDNLNDKLDKILFLESRERRRRGGDDEGGVVGARIV